VSRLLTGARTAVFGVASLILAALPFEASAADKVFLSLQGIAGSSIQVGHLNWMDILSFSFGAASNATIGATGTTATAGRPDVSSITVMKLADRADVPMLRSLLLGAKIPTGTLDIVGTVGTTQETVARINLTNARITSVQTSGSNSTPVVSVSIAYEKIQLINNQYSVSGSVSGQDSVTYDVLKNAVTTP
jgi:type VI secretion system secreted protein Hcp